MLQLAHPKVAHPKPAFPGQCSQASKPTANAVRFDARASTVILHYQDWQIHWLSFGIVPDFQPLLVLFLFSVAYLYIWKFFRFFQREISISWIRHISRETSFILKKLFIISGLWAFTHLSVCTEIPKKPVTYFAFMNGSGWCSCMILAYGAL